MLKEKRVVAYFNRHGNTEGNDKKIFRGQIDFPLNAKGKQQAEQAKKFLSDQSIGAVFSSPLQRALETCNIAVGYRGLQPVIIRGFLPLNTGKLQGLPKAGNEAIVIECNKNWNKKFPGGESINDIVARARIPILNAINLGVDNGKASGVFVHSSIMHVLGYVIVGDDKACLVAPGGTIAVLFDGHGFETEAVHKPTEKDTMFGQ